MPPSEKFQSWTAPGTVELLVKFSAEAASGYIGCAGLAKTSDLANAEKADVRSALMRRRTVSLRLFMGETIVETNH